jgi:acyl carrier protein
MTKPCFGIKESKMENLAKLKKLVEDVFLLQTGEFRTDLRRDEVETWDSFGVVSLAVGIQETFGYHLSPAEAVGIKSVADIISLLSAKGIKFDH